MDVKEIIEDMMIRDVKGLCSSCAHVHTCVYYKTAEKEIIQCELFELDSEHRFNSYYPKALCKSCDNATACKLPGRNEGVWHCNEFK